MADINKLWNLEYEKCVLGSMLLDNTTIDMAIVNLKKDMFSAKNQPIFEAICDEYNRNKMCELLQLCTRLRGVSDMSYLASLSDSVGSASNAEFYMKEVKKLWTSRQMLNYTRELQEKLNERNGIDLANELDSKVISLMNSTNGAAISGQTLVQGLLDDLQNKFSLDRKYLGYETKWPKFDEILDGTQRGQLYFLSARASIGKTAFALAWMQSLLNQNIPCTYFSYEMGWKQLGLRMAAADSEIPLKTITSGMIMHTQALLNKLNMSLGKIFESPVKVYDSTTGLGDENTLYSRIRVQAKKEGCKVFFIDQLSLIPSAHPELQERQQIGKITKKLLQLCQELDIAIICLCQLNRGAEGSQPSLAELKGSGSIEEDADVVILIDRDRPTGAESQIETKVVIAKNRNGSVGTSEMMFMPKFATFFETDGTTKEEFVA